MTQAIRLRRVLTATLILTAILTVFPIAQGLHPPRRKPAEDDRDQAVPDLSDRLARRDEPGQRPHPMRGEALRREPRQGVVHRQTGNRASTRPRTTAGVARKASTSISADTGRHVPTPTDSTTGPPQRPSQHHGDHAHGEALRLGRLGRLTSTHRTARAWLLPQRRRASGSRRPHPSPASHDR